MSLGRLGGTLVDDGDPQATDGGSGSSKPLASFRGRPPSPDTPRLAFAAAGRAAAVAWTLARRAWLEGWPAAGVEPLRELVAREQQAARATLTLAARLGEATAAATADGAQQRAAEGLCARAAGSVAAGLLGELVGVVAPQVRKMLSQLDASPPPDAGAALERLRSLVSVAERVVALAGHAQQQQRLVLGEPGMVVGLAFAPMGLEEAAAESRSSGTRPQARPTGGA